MQRATLDLVDIDGEIIRLNMIKERGENVDLATRNKDEQPQESHCSMYYSIRTYVFLVLLR